MSASTVTEPSRRASNRADEEAVIIDTIRCDAASGRIHHEIIEAFPHSGLRFVLHEVCDADGQDGGACYWEVPADALHTEVYDWVTSNALAPGYATVIADRALGAAVADTTPPSKAHPRHVRTISRETAHGFLSSDSRCAGLS